MDQVNVEALAELLGGMAAFCVVVGVGLLVNLLIASFVMWLAAKIAAVKEASFFRAVGAVILSGILGFGAAFGAGLVGLPFAFACLLALLGTWLGIKIAFATSLGKALIVWICEFLVAAFLIGLLWGMLFLLGAIGAAAAAP